MKIAVVGSRNLFVEDFSKIIAEGDELVSGGAKGIDTCAANYAKRRGIKVTVFLPEYKRYGRAAPIIRNRKIVEYADKVVVFWNGESKGSLSAIEHAKKVGKEYEVILCKK